MFDDLTALTSFPKLHSSSSDNLLKHLIPYNGYFLNVYRLLFFIRTILHYATLPESPVMNHQTIWLPVLQGLHDVTMNIDFHFLPREARADIWKVLHTIGRSDLVPYEERGPLEAQPKLDYSSVFEQFPVIGGTLRSLTNAIVMQNNDQHMDNVMDCASAPAIMLHDEDAVAIEMESNDAGGGFLQSGGNVHRRSYPPQGHSPDCFAQHDDLLKLQNEPSQSL